MNHCHSRPGPVDLALGLLLSDRNLTMHFTHYHFQPRPRDVGGGSKKKENYAQGLGHLQKNSIYQSLLRLENELLEKCYWRLFGSDISFEINSVGNFTMPILPVPLWLFPLIALYCVILLAYKKTIFF